MDLRDDPFRTLRGHGVRYLVLVFAADADMYISTSALPIDDAAHLRHRSTLLVQYSTRQTKQHMLLAIKIVRKSGQLLHHCPLHLTLVLVPPPIIIHHFHKCLPHPKDVVGTVGSWRTWRLTLGNSYKESLLNVSMGRIDKIINSGIIRKIANQ